LKTCFEKAGALAAGLTVALLAGCGGGGGGGGGGSTPSPTPNPLIIAGPSTVPAGGAGSVGSAGPAGGAEVDVPAAPSGGLTLTLLSDPTAPPIPTTLYRQYSSVFDIEPAGAQLGSTGVVLKIHYNDSTSDGDAQLLAIYYYDTTTGTYQRVQNGLGQSTSVTNTGAHQIAATVTQFAAGRGGNGSGPTDYVVLGPTPIPPPPAAPSARPR